MPTEDNSLDQSQEFNSGFTKQFEAMMSKVLDMYENIQETPSLPISEGGTGAGFVQNAWDEVRNRDGMYSFTGSLFLQDLRWRPFPLTPVNAQGVQELVSQLYGQGPPAVLSFEVTLVSGDHGDDIMAGAGRLRRVSPEEPVWALLFAASQANTEEEKAQYRNLMLSCRFNLLPKTNVSDILKEAISVRERLIDNSRAVKRSALSMLVLIISRKNELETDSWSDLKNSCRCAS